MVARHSLNVKLLVRVQTPQPIRTCPPLFDVAKGGGEVKMKQRCLLKRFAALVAALVISFSLSVPAFAVGHDWPTSVGASSFREHPNSWYVWQRKTLTARGFQYTGYELISNPMYEYYSTDTSSSFTGSYSTNSGTYSYTSSGSTKTFIYAFPYIPASFTSAGFWRDLPSFPVGSPSRYSGAVRLYPIVWNGDYLSTVPDVFADCSVFAFLTSWPSSVGSSIADQYEHETFDTYPVYIPSNIFFFGSKTDTSSSHSSFAISGGSNDFWATPSNDKYIDLTSSHLSNTSMSSFPPNVNIPSSDLGIVFCKRPSGDGMHVYNSEFDVTLTFAATLWVPDALLPADVKVGDWISKASVKDLQDELTNQFDINSDTLTNSKDNLNSWNSTPSVDSDIGSGAIGLLNGIFQNLGTFLFSVSLLCFGAVVLRLFIRKAVDG